MDLPQQIGDFDQRIHALISALRAPAAVGTSLTRGVTIRVPFSILTPSSFP
jgi:hypothetical protein